MSVRRIFVEKKPDYAVKAGELREELVSYLGITGVKSVRVLIRYDIENLSEDTYTKALGTIFSEPPVDEVYEEEFPKNPGDLVFSVEYLPGQFDQRADSAMQCVKLLKEDEEPVIRTATTYVITAPLTLAQEDAIRHFCINPVDSRQAEEDKPKTLVTEFDVPEDIKSFEGFAKASEEELKALYDTLNLAMTFKDFLYIQQYYAGEEHRDPTVTEIRVLDTYWSDHCLSLIHIYPLPIAAVVLPTESNLSVISRTDSSRPDISAIPPALSAIGPYASIATVMPVVESIPTAARAIP